MRIAPAQSAQEPQNRPPAGSDESLPSYTLIAYFRETNAAGLRVRERLALACELAEKERGESPALEAFGQTQLVIEQEVIKAKGRADGISDLLVGDPKNHASYALELVQVTNGWDDLNMIWEPVYGQNAPLAKLSSCATQSFIALDKLIFICACQTIPEELNRYLANYRIGKCLDFVATFKDQLPDEKMTREVLEWLAPQSGAVDGLIDPENAKVIKADPRWWRQVASVSIVTGTAALGFGLIAFAVGIGGWFQMDAKVWPAGKQQWGILNAAYLFALLGVLGHWILDRVKQNRAGSDITPLAEWLMWIHINEVPISIRIVTVWLIVLVAVAFRTFDLTKGIQPVTYFTAGYFLDSTYDALIGRLNTFVNDKSPEKEKAAKSEDRQPGRPQ